MSDKTMQEKMEILNDLTDELVTFLRARCKELDLPESGLPSVLLNAYPEVCYPHIEKCVNEVGGKQAKVYIGIQAKHIQHIVKQLATSDKDIDEFIKIDEKNAN